SNQNTLVKTNDEKRTLVNFQANPIAWSPDGKAIACAVRETDETGMSYRVLLVDPTDGSEKYLSEKRWTTVESIAWKNNEDLALIDFEPDSPISSIWEISRSSGEARQLTDYSNSYQWLSSANGNLYAVQKRVFSTLHVADFDGTTRTPQSKELFGENNLIDNV